MLSRDDQLRIANANLYQLKDWLKQPASDFPRGVKAAIKRELAEREASMVCQGCGRKVQATLGGRCGACLRFGAQPGRGDYCKECGDWQPESRLFGGRCPECHLETVGYDPQFIRAGEELPAVEVFSTEELMRLEFIKHEVRAGRMGS